MQCISLLQAVSELEISSIDIVKAEEGKGALIAGGKEAVNRDGWAHFPRNAFRLCLR